MTDTLCERGGFFFWHSESEEISHICSCFLWAQVHFFSCSIITVSLTLFFHHGLCFCQPRCCWFSTDLATLWCWWWECKIISILLSDVIFPYILSIVFRFKYCLYLYKIAVINTFLQIMATLKGKSWMTFSCSCWRN